jgi:S1-C subfamily serine protease
MRHGLPSRPRRRSAGALALSLVLPATGVRADAVPDAPPRKVIDASARGFGAAASVYERVAPAIVGIAARRGRGEPFMGTGTIIDPTGLVLTAVTVVPRDAWQIRVFLRGGRVVPGRLVRVEEEKELALVRIGSAGARAEFPHVKLGDSRAVEIGEPAFTFGNAFESIESDDQITLGEGLVSGIYDLTRDDLLTESRYLGPVLETSAPLNDGMDGGPLIARDGTVIGLLILGYSKNRWLGTAIPVGELKPLLGAERGWFNDRDEPFAAYAGLELEEVAGLEVRILRVHADGPAVRAGLKAGERISGVGGKDLESMAPFRAAFVKAAPGEELELEVEAAGGVRRRVAFVLGGRF